MHFREGICRRVDSTAEDLRPWLIQHLKSVNGLCILYSSTQIKYPCHKEKKGVTKWRSITLSKNYNDIRSEKVIMISSLRAIDKFSHVKETFKRNYEKKNKNRKNTVHLLKNIHSLAFLLSSVHCYPFGVLLPRFTSYVSISRQFYELQKCLFVVTYIAPLKIVPRSQDNPH